MVVVGVYMGGTRGSGVLSSKCDVLCIESSSSSCDQTFVFHCSAHLFPITFNFRRSFKCRVYVILIGWFYIHVAIS